MSRAKELFLKCLPMLIVLVSTGIFMFLIKFVIGIFYEPRDTVTKVEYAGEKFTVVQCYQNPSSHYYIFSGDYEYNADNYNNVAGEHDDAHFADRPLAYFILNETPLDMSDINIKVLIDTNSLYAVQFDEFVLYKLEGQYGVFAPLREYKESTTARKNDLYVIRQLMKNDRYLEFDLPEWESEEDFLAQLEQIEWYLDSEYED